MKISACWIAKNEEKNLPRSIRSVSRLADELIVVDTGSEDATAELARSLRAKVYDFAWIGDFSAARNFALSKASGDVCVFLDADEWFQPALTRNDRQVIDQVFGQKNIDALYVKMTHVSEDTNKRIEITDSVRIFRLRDSIQYTGSIHEGLQKLTSEGWKYLVVNRPIWNVNHSGYSSGILTQKADRNIAMLNEAVEQETDPFELYLLHSYLLRENASSNRYDEAFPHLQFLLDHPEQVDDAYTYYKQDFLQRIFLALFTGKRHRNQVSREQIYTALIQPAKKHYPDIDFQILELFYQLLFACHPARFLDAFSYIHSQIQKETEGKGYVRLRAANMLRIEAASLHMEMEAYDKAFDILNVIVQDADFLDHANLSLLLRCLYNQPDDAVIRYLLSFLDLDKQAVCASLSEILVRLQRKNIFLYLQKKLLDAGKLSKPDFLYLMLINANYEQIGKQASSMEFEESQSEMQAEVERILFLAAIASNDEAFYLGHKNQLAKYEKLLDAYFSRTPLESATVGDMAILTENYHLLTFAAGLEAADRLAMLFSAYPNRCFLLKARYYYSNRMDAEIAQLSRDGIPLFEKDSHYYVCRSLIRRGEYEECLAILEEMLQGSLYDDQLFTLLFILSQKGQNIAWQAKEYYNQYLPIYESTIDSMDEGILHNAKDKLGQTNGSENEPAVVCLEDYRMAKAPDA